MADNVSYFSNMTAGLLVAHDSNTSEDIVLDNFTSVTNKSLVWPELNLTYLFSQEQCTSWAPINHIYFQLANVFLLLSFLAPYGLWGLLYLRSTLVIACSFYSLWSWTVTCYLDAAAWNAVFVILNLLWALGTAWRLRPVSLSRDMNTVYTQLFRPLKVSKRQFQSVLSKTRQVRKVCAQETIIHEKVSRVDSLSLVLQGRLVVSQGGKALHIVSQHQFLDSPEWFGVTTDEYFQVSVTALEDCSVLVWHRDKLKFQMMSDPFLQAVFDHVLGRDVVNKLMQAQHSDDSGPSGNGHVSNGHVAGEGQGEENDDWDDEKPMLIKTKELGLVTTVLGGDSACWRLGKINETENETVV